MKVSVLVVLVLGVACLALAQDESEHELMVAILQDNDRKVMELLRSGADPMEPVSGGWTPLHAAASKGQDEWVKLMIENGALLDVTNEQDRTALHEAVSERHASTAELLLESGASPDIADFKGDVALHIAAGLGDLNVVKTLLKYRAKINLQNNNEATPLYFASAFGNADVLKYLISRGANVDTPTSRKITPLHEACISGNVEVISTLLDNGADPSAASVDGWTAFHNAAQFGRHEALELLLSESEELDDEVKKTVLFLAALNGTAECVEVLLDHGFDPNLTDSNGTSAAHAAAYRGDAAMLSSLIDSGVNKNARDSEGATPLHKAAFNSHTECIALLLDAGADPNLATYERRWTPLLVAAAAKASDAIALLLQHGADANHVSLDKYNAIMLVSAQGDVAAAKALIKGGAKLNVVDGSGWTALHAAVRNNQLEFVKSLLAGSVDPDFTANTLTPLQMAAAFGFDAIANALLDAGASASRTDGSGWNALHHAAAHGHAAIARTLLSLDVDVNAVTDDEGATAAKLAENGGHDAVLGVLSAAGADLSALDVAAFLERNNLAPFIDSFTSQEITGDLFPMLDSAFLREALGVTKAGDLLRFKVALKPFVVAQSARHDEL